MSDNPGSRRNGANLDDEARDTGASRTASTMEARDNQGVGNSQNAF